MATKLNFRARTLDASKPMSVYHSEDLPDLADLNAINRSVPAMPSGMEKEEEAEKHLQDILESQDKHNSSITEEKAEKKAETAEAAPDPQLLFIPTPDVFVSAADADGTYETIYKNSFKMPRSTTCSLPHVEQCSSNIIFKNTGPSSMSSLSLPTTTSRTMTWTTRTRGSSTTSSGAERRQLIYSTKIGCRLGN